MAQYDEKLTFIACGAVAQINWVEVSRRADVAIFDSARAPFAELAPTMNDLGCEVVRIVLDGACGELAFLRALTALPASFRGDVLYVHSTNLGFLSAVGRGDDRVLYELAAKDMEFYLVASLGLSRVNWLETPYATPLRLAPRHSMVA